MLYTNLKHHLIKTQMNSTNTLVLVMNYEMMSSYQHQYSSAISGLAPGLFIDTVCKWVAV